MTYREIVEGLRSCNREIENEGRLVSAGLKDEQQTAQIVKRFAWLYSDEALTVAAAAEKESSTAIEREAARRVRVAIMQGMINGRKAALDDRLSTHYATSSVTLPGGETMPFFTAASMLAREPDPRRREQLGEASARVIVEGDDLALQVASVTQDVIKGFGYDSYTGFWEGVTGVDYKMLHAELSRVAAARLESYKKWISPRMEAIGTHFGECSRWHVFYMRRLPAYDSLFTRERFEPVMRRTFATLGLDLFSLATVHMDLDDRPTKAPRASVSVIEAGVEVHLLTRPLGGNLAAFLHEGAHALHFGLTDPAIGWPLANLGRSSAYAELWSYLIERIGYEPSWLQEALGVDESKAESIATDLAGIDLMMFMRYCAKLTYELELFAGDPLDRDRGRDLYASLLSGGTGFRYGPEGWQYDRDAGFYSADYLRAWLAEAALQERLVEMFGARWWASADAGSWLRDQWHKGSIPEAEETVAAAGGKPWSGDALVRMWGSRL